MELLIWSIFGLLAYVAMVVLTRRLYTHENSYEKVYEKDNKIRFPRITYIIIFIVMIIPVVNLSVFILFMTYLITSLVLDRWSYKYNRDTKLYEFLHKKI